MKTDVDVPPLDYAQIRAQHEAAKNVCTVTGCTNPVVARYGRNVFDGAGMVFVVTERYCATHDVRLRGGRFVIEHCG